MVSRIEVLLPCPTTDLTYPLVHNSLHPVATWEAGICPTSRLLGARPSVLDQVDPQGLGDTVY